MAGELMPRPMAVPVNRQFRGVMRSQNAEHLLAVREDAHRAEMAARRIHNGACLAQMAMDAVTELDHEATHRSTGRPGLELHLRFIEEGYVVGAHGAMFRYMMRP